MNENNKSSENISRELESKERREAVRKLGKFVAYAAPFTLLASNVTAQQSGSGSGGRKHSQTQSAQQH